MSFTLEQYETLKAAIASGATKVKYADKEVEYQTLDNMLRIKGLMEQELGINKAGSNRKVLATYRSGNRPSNNNYNENKW